jgi:glycerophosphoryl diester phosphodiesterase
VELLERHGLDRADAAVFVQSFEVDNLRRLKSLTHVPLIQLIEAAGRPWDATLGRSARTYADMLTPDGLREIARYARGIGVDKILVLPRDGDGRLRPATRLVPTPTLLACWSTSSRCGPRTASCRPTSGAPKHLRHAAISRPRRKRFLKAGVDGYFVDQPEIGVRARDAFLRRP